jgi:ABC-type nitrate/sulfonate/bicarbonate transport system permease component
MTQLETLDHLGRGRAATSDRLIQAGVVAGILILWELVGRQVGGIILAPPSAVARALVEMTASGEMLTAVRDSLLSLLIGFSLALGLGLLVGGVIGWKRVIGEVLDPFISAFYVVPIAALVPLIIIWFGIGALPRIITIVLFSVFEITIATATAVRGVDPRLVEMARSFGAGTRQVVAKVVIFAAFPVAFAGVRIGLGRAVQGMVTAELLFAVTGLGGLVMRYSGVYRLDKVLATIVVIALLGVLTIGVAQLIERRVVRKTYG